MEIVGGVDTAGDREDRKEEGKEAARCRPQVALRQTCRNGRSSLGADGSSSESGAAGVVEYREAEGGR